MSVADAVNLLHRSGFDTNVYHDQCIRRNIQSWSRSRVSISTTSEGIVWLSFVQPDIRRPNKYGPQASMQDAAPVYQASSSAAGPWPQITDVGIQQAQDSQLGEYVITG